jgi:hypothetical protein
MRRLVNIILMVVLFMLILGLILVINADVKISSSDSGKIEVAENQKQNDSKDIPNINLSPSDMPKLMEALKLWKLIDDLGLEKLGDDKMMAFITKYKQLEKTRFEYHNARKEALKELQKLTETNESEQKVKSKLDDIKSMDKVFFEKDLQLVNNLNSYLTSSQQAKFIIFQDNYWRDMRQIMRNLKEIAALKEKENKMKFQPEILSKE